MSTSRPFDRAPSARSGQLTLADLGTPLNEVTFVVVDLETTGTRGDTSEITEIGAVRSRGGEVTGEFSTLVKPREQQVSPFVERLTGITNAMLVDAPDLAAVLPSFLEFAHGAVLVAHNAPFDIGFLRRACADLDHPWPDPTVVDTVRLGRMLLPRPEVRDHKLGTLARYVGTSVEPDHRALSDARATLQVLDHFLGLLGGYGVETLQELTSLRQKGWEVRRTRMPLARDVPHGPGVYTFLDAASRVLYIGSAQDMRTRVRQYFNAGETRGRMADMLVAATGVRTIPCDTVVEARVREVRLIAEQDPPYNRRSRRPESRLHWLRLTTGDFGRLSVTRTRPETTATPVLGPFPSRKRAETAKRLLEDLLPLKTCTRRPGAADFTPCPAGEMGRCAGPCAGDPDPGSYRAGLGVLDELSTGRPEALVEAARARMTDLTLQERFETAAVLRDDLVDLLRMGTRWERRDGLRALAEVQAAAPRPQGGWDVAVLRYGRLVGTAAVPAGANPYRALDSLVLTAESVDGPTGTLDEETDLVHAWLTDGTTRLVRIPDAPTEGDTPTVPGLVRARDGFEAHLAHLLPTPA
ncbi:DEDD exonuclease domain-containing protein [Brevibacterium litoralis]|uniref:DEDD exonuclease domain-containing protein n=1 Tax=Brevibacterium litoralis TaxID=3138935 RepID=UPI0032EB8EEF